MSQQSFARLRQEGIDVSIETTVTLTPRLLAEAYAQMSDESQAQFFIELADLSKDWDGGGHFQWYSVGAHLRTCTCATPASRELVRQIANGIGTETL